MRDLGTIAWKSFRDHKELFSALAIVAAMFLYLYLGTDDSGAHPWLSNFKGNVVGETLGGIVFLLLGAFLQTEIEKLQRETNALQKEMSGVQSRMQNVQDEMNAVLHETRNLQREMHRTQAETRELVDCAHLPPDERDSMLQFKRFLWHEKYHNIRFPDLTTQLNPYGLQYTIAPERDDLGRPKLFVTEMQHRYSVVTVRRPAFADTLSPEALEDYQRAPIHTNEPYFCEFYNGAWHIGRDTMTGRDSYRFELSTKVGPMERTISAAEFLQLPLVPSNARLVKELIVGDDGIGPANEGWMVRIYQVPGGDILVQPSATAPAKAAYVRVNVRTDERQLVIANLEGYFPAEARPRFLALVENTVANAGLGFRTEEDWF